MSGNFVRRHSRRKRRLLHRKNRVPPYFIWVDLVSTPLSGITITAILMSTQKKRKKKKWGKKSCKITSFSNVRKRHSSCSLRPPLRMPNSFKNRSSSIKQADFLLAGCLESFLIGKLWPASSHSACLIPKCVSTEIQCSSSDISVTNFEHF